MYKPFRIILFCLLLGHSHLASAVDFEYRSLFSSGIFEICQTLISSAIHIVGQSTSFSALMQSEEQGEKVKRKKKSQAEQNESYQQNAKSRIDDAARKIEVKKEVQEDISSSDRTRSISIENTEAKKLERGRNQEKYSRKGDARITENKLRIEERKNRNSGEESESSWRSFWTRLRSKWENARLKRLDERRASEQRIKNSELRAKKKRERNDQMQKGLNSPSDQNARKINNQKSEIQYTNQKKDLDSKNSRFEKRNEVHRKKTASPKDEKEYLAVPGTEDLKEGVTESSYKMGNKMITERIVKVGNKVDRYKKVVSKTGIYYFCNDRSITDQIWRQATLAQPE